MPRTRAISVLLLGATLATSTTGCLKGDLAKVAIVAAVVAVKTAELAAASSRREARTRYATAAAMPPSRPLEGCGRCPEPDNGYAICFVSTCEVRCIEGYTLSGDTCAPAPPSE